MKSKPRWMKRVVETARDDRTALPFQRAVKGNTLTLPLKKVATA